MFGQFANAELPMLVAFGKLNVVSDEQYANAFCPMLVTLGKLAVVSA